jgi:[histone H3]-lysine36 N-dimethyltransferase SETMAR
VALITKETIMELGWEELPHPAYSPDLAPSDYHLFRSIEHFLQEKSFRNHEELKKELDFFFSIKNG